MKPSLRSMPPSVAEVFGQCRQILANTPNDSRPETPMAGASRRIPLGQIGPRSAGPQNPEDSVEHLRRSWGGRPDLPGPALPFGMILCDDCSHCSLVRTMTSYRLQDPALP